MDHPPLRWQPRLSPLRPAALVIEPQGSGFAQALERLRAHSPGQLASLRAWRLDAMRLIVTGPSGLLPAPSGALMLGYEDELRPQLLLPCFLQVQLDAATRAAWVKLARARAARPRSSGLVALLPGGERGGQLVLLEGAAALTPRALQELEHAG